MSTAKGQQAETAASRYLQQKGYRIVARNWRTKTCEIDIIATKKSRLLFGEIITYFIEVKYRTSGLQGGGIEYITDKKLAQMTYAAQTWCAQQGYDGSYRLSAVEVTSSDFIVTRFISSITD